MPKKKQAAEKRLVFFDRTILETRDCDINDLIRCNRIRPGECNNGKVLPQLRDAVFRERIDSEEEYRCKPLSWLYPVAASPDQIDRGSCPGDASPRSCARQLLGPRHG